MHTLPPEVIAEIYEYDDAYKNQMKLILHDISNLPKRKCIIEKDIVAEILTFSSESLLISDGPFVDRENYNFCTSRLQDHINVVLNDYQCYRKLLWSNLLRDYNFDGWGTEILNIV